MAINLKVSCGLCGFTHYVKTVDGENGLLPVPMRSGTLPDITFVKTESGGRGKIRHYHLPIAELHGVGGEYTEHAVLEQVRDNAQIVATLCELRMDEL